MRITTAHPVPPIYAAASRSVTRAPIATYRIQTARNGAFTDYGTETYAGVDATRAIAAIRRADTAGMYRLRRTNPA